MGEDEFHQLTGWIYAGAAAVIMGVGVIVGRITAPEQEVQISDGQVGSDEADGIAVTVPVPRTCDTAMLMVSFGEPNVIEVGCKYNDGSVPYSSAYRIGGGLPLNREPADPDRHTKIILELVPPEQLAKP